MSEKHTVELRLGDWVPHKRQNLGEHRSFPMGDGDIDYVKNQYAYYLPLPEFQLGRDDG